jgi:signal transduction histidine kinase/HAMP domain-containing protein
MKLRIKDKLRLGLVFLFGVILLLATLGIFFTYQLQQDSGAILKDNYRSLEYVRAMQRVLDDLQRFGRADLTVFEENLRAEEANLTEVGEPEVVQQLRAEWNAFRREGTAAGNRILVLRQYLHEVNNLNLQAIVRKNDQAESTAKTAVLVIALVGTVCVLVAFSFTVNFPSYIAGPIRQLTESLKEVTNRNFETRLHFQSNDEFGEMAQTFNRMVDRLDEYEHSNLAQILSEKRRLETLIDHLRDAVIGLDDRRMILFANPVALQLLNLKPAELVGKYAPDVALQNDLLRRLLRPVAADEGELNIFADERESYFRRELVDVEIDADTAADQRGQLAGELATRLQPGKQRIGQVILLKNVTHYHDLDEAKTHFIATISHELKTPISSIKMSAKLLGDARVGTLNPEQTHLLQHVHDDTDRLLRITGELLDWSQVETGKIQFQVRPVDVRELIEYAREATRVPAGQKLVRVQAEYPAEVPMVLADSEKSTWVLINLLTNAIRYSPEGSEVTIRVHPEGEQLRLDVIDRGPGIAPQYQQTVFERYFRVPGSEGRTGTGLGLAISREFVEAQGGRLQLESQPGQGSTFRLTLPVAERAEVPT